MVAASGLLLPRGSISIMELGPQSHSKDGLSIPNSIMVVYMDPLGYKEPGGCEWKFPKIRGTLLWGPYSKDLG